MNPEPIIPKSNDKEKTFISSNPMPEINKKNEVPENNWKKHTEKCYNKIKKAWKDLIKLKIWKNLLTKKWI